MKGFLFTKSFILFTFGSHKYKDNFKVVFFLKMLLASIKKIKWGVCISLILEAENISVSCRPARATERDLVSERNGGR